MSDLSSSLVIAGAGAAGLAGALAAAKLKTQVVLLEKSGQLGGTVTNSLIHTLGGFFDDQGDVINTGLSVELIDRLTEASPLTCKRRIGKTWVLSVDPKVYQQVIASWLNEHPSIEVCYQASISQVAVNDHRIDRLTVTGNGQARTLNTLAVIDSTGQADIVRSIDARLVTEGAALAGLIVQLRGVSQGVMQFPKGLALLRHIRKATENHDLPPECATLWLDSGVYPDEVYVKFNFLATAYDASRMTVVANQLLSFLQALPDFSKAFIGSYGQLGSRDGGRVHGAYTLTEADLKQGRQFDDAVCRACWPIEHWHLEHGVSLDYFPPGHNYDIPLSALKVSGLNNLFVAGKCFSAEPRAQASARVVGSCWAMGEGLVNATFGNLK
ncbi:MAG: FAD-dependent oxidoreductase [Methylobacter sp.]|nr:MAG: FAD-dependent oxidoreductase [Methylobacter sp.]